MKQAQNQAKTEFNQRESLRILLVSTSDLGGGAEHSAWNLLKTYNRRNYRTSLAVGNKRTTDPNVLLIPNHSSRNLWARLCLGTRSRLLRARVKTEGMKRLAQLCLRISEPQRWSERNKGYEDFSYPGTQRLLQLTERPDVVHCFNLHGGYFDLRLLNWLSHQLPVILDLRDAWLLSGHCAHSFDCERWKLGCGHCPDLKIPIAVQKDATAHNWERKRDIYAKSRLYVSTPCNWLMQKVEQSILAPAIVESRIIPTGVNLTTFNKADKRAARAAVNLPQDAKILLFAANGIRQNFWKDYETLRTAIARVGMRHGQDILFVALGDNGPPEPVSGANIQFIPYQKSPNAVARYYQAADLYVHAARADTFPRTVLEALACGVPVVATGICGIHEQVKPLDCRFTSSSAYEARSHTPDEATGILVSPGDTEAMALGIEQLLGNDPLREQLSANAVSDARQRFNLEVQADRYLEWYGELCRRHNDVLRTHFRPFI